jgi:hypothetical protein
MGLLEVNKNGLNLLTPTSVDYVGTSAAPAGNGSILLTACTSVSLNGVFSERYENYMMMMRFRNTSQTTYYARMRLNGVDNVENSYSQWVWADGTTINASNETNNFFRIAQVSIAPNQNGSCLYIYGPNIQKATALRSIAVDTYLDVSIFEASSLHKRTNVQYDGITIAPISGSLTGRIAVYGMRD